DRHRRRREAVQRGAEAEQAAGGDGVDAGAGVALARRGGGHHGQRPRPRHAGDEGGRVLGVGHAGPLPGATIAGRVAPLGIGWPNIISALRIVLVPVLVALVLVDTRSASIAAAVVFVLGGLSDGLDGYLARRHSMTTRTGVWLDPLSDKLLVSAAVISLVIVDRFPLLA